MKNLSKLGRWVPLEATEEMLSTGFHYWVEAGDVSVRGIYTSIANAAPSAPTEALEKVVSAARQYRAAEAEETPRMWRGEHLHDLGLELDGALAELEAAIEEKK